MEFKPFNRYVLVQKEAQAAPRSEEQKSTILVPESYVPESPYGVYRVLSVASDCERLSSDMEGRLLLVNSSMVEKVEIPGHTFSMVLENYIYGAFSNENAT
jgi:hypothetical protein